MSPLPVNPIASSPAPPANDTLDQRRARHAWEAVREIVRKFPPQMVNGKPVADKQAKRYGGQAKKLPMRIMASGLGQALAFLKAKNYAPDLLMDVADWVLDKRANPNSRKPRPDDKALLTALISKEATSDLLRRATDEVLAYLQWLNRFAEAEKLTEGESE